jgi:hypothetical protein
MNPKHGDSEKPGKQELALKSPEVPPSTQIDETPHNSTQAGTSDPLLTTKEAAAMLRLKPTTLSKWRWEKRGPQYVRVFTGVRYPLSALHAWLYPAQTPPATGAEGE